MSSLTHIEKLKIERELGMASGYVMNFSNRTFEEFFREVVGVEIFDRRFDRASGSKANRMRAFWDLASNDEVVRLFKGLIEAWEVYAGSPIPNACRDLLRGVIQRLAGNSQAAELISIKGLSEIDSSAFDALLQRLIKLSELEPQTRGFQFERFLRDLFEANGLSPRASFRLVGEQIDGSFELRDETYLLEAKWQNAPIGVGDLHTFEGKLREKASWSRGLFLSISGFSQDGLSAFGRGKHVVCMDGFDLSEILARGVSFEKAFAAKVRRAAETGSPYVSVRDLDL